jgi:hypothetical protein
LTMGNIYSVQWIVNGQIVQSHCVILNPGDNVIIRAVYGLPGQNVAANIRINVLFPDGTVKLYQSVVHEPSFVVTNSVISDDIPFGIVSSRNIYNILHAEIWWGFIHWGVWDQQYLGTTINFTDTCPSLCVPAWQCEQPLNGYESDGCGNRRTNSACNPCVPNWQCEQPLNGYESDGCGNRRTNSACNLTIAKITAISFTPSQTSCIEPCSLSVDITWRNDGDMTGSFEPSIVVDTVRTGIGTQVPLSKGQTDTRTFQLNLMKGVHTICPDPN